MGGLNSLSGLNNVNVDFRPTVDLSAQKKVDANQKPQQEGEVDDANKAPPPERAQAKSVVRQLDVLLLNAANKSVSASAAQDKVTNIGKSLVSLGVLRKNEASNLDNLAKTAAKTLMALDKFSGKDLAKALMRKQADVIDWSTGKAETVNKEVIDWVGENEADKAVQAAIDAQQKLSEALSDFNDRLAASNAVDADMQEQFMELQFQCDRRASEIDSIVFRMFGLAQEDVVNGADGDKQIKALLDAKFNELMPREAIMMHGTAEALEKMNKTFAGGTDQNGKTMDMPKLVAKLNEFAEDGNKILSNNELIELRNDITTIHGNDWKKEYNNRVSLDKGIVRNGDGTMTVDLSKVTSPEIKMTIVAILGLQSISLPTEIDEDFYNKLMEMVKDEKVKQEFLDSIAPRISPEALEATKTRLNEAIEHAKTLAEKKKVYGEGQWKSYYTLFNMPTLRGVIDIINSDGKKITAKGNIKCVGDLCQANCPSYYTRDYFDRMFLPAKKK